MTKFVFMVETGRDKNKDSILREFRSNDNRQEYLS